MHIAKIAIVVTLSNVSPVSAEVCDPAKHLLQDKSLSFSQNELATAWAYSEAASQNSSSNANAKASLIIGDVSVPFGVSTAKSLAETISKNANYSLNSSKKNFLLTSKLSQAGLDAYKACLISGSMPTLFVSGDPESSELTINVGYKGGPLQNGAKMKIGISNGKLVYSGRDGVTSLDLPWSNGSSGTYLIIGRDPTKSTIVTANLVPFNGASLAAEPQEVPPAISSHFAYRLRADTRRNILSNSREWKSQRRCINTNNTETSGLLFKQSAKWSNVDKSADGTVEYPYVHTSIDTNSNSNLSVCGVLKVRSKRDYTKVRVRATLTVYEVFVVPNANYPANATVQKLK